MNEPIQEQTMFQESGESMNVGPMQRSALPPSFSLSTSPNQRSVIQRNPRYNYMELNPGSRDYRVNEGGTEAIQQRLIELGFLEEGNFTWGTRDAATREAIREFQSSEQGSGLIAEVRGDSRDLHDESDVHFDGHGNPRHAQNPNSQAGTRRRSGEVRDNDSTHQALANAFPRRIFGRLVQNQAEAFTLIQSTVISRSLPFDPQAVNVVGVRAYQGGRAHANQGARTALNQYNDTFFVLTLNEQGEQVVREFRGTTDPGGRDQFRTTEDPRTHIMASDQQSPYRLFHTSPKFGRPMLGQVVGDPEHPQVVDPGRAAHLEEMQADGRSFHRNPDEARNPGHPLDRSGRGDAYDSIRTLHGRDGDMLKNSGIAIHSGGGWNDNTTSGDSLACQVVHGDWYGNFIQTVRRGLTWGRIRRGEVVPEDVRALDNTGIVTYSLIDARDFMPVTGSAD